MILDLDQYAAEIGAADDRETLFYALRVRFSDHSAIASLASTKLVSRDPDLLREMDERMALFFDDLGNCPFDTWDGVRHALHNGERVANAPTTADMRGHHAGVPAIVLGAGPGAASRLDALKDARKGAILFVCDVMLGPCLERGIIPDYVSAVERVPITFECMARFPKDGMTLLGPPVLEPRLVQDFGGRVVWTWRGCSLERWLCPEAAPNDFGHSCGTSAIGAALLAGCSPIYLVGHDLCMQSGKTHCGEADDSTKATAENLNTSHFHMVSDATNVHGQPVQTTHLWRMFRQDIELQMKQHPRAVVINTGDGLPLAGSTLGELPTTWASITDRAPPVRKVPGEDPRRHLLTMLYRDIPKIRKRCDQVSLAPTPSHRDLLMSRMTDERTALIWSEILQSLYYGALVRMHLQPEQEHEMLRRTAHAIERTLPTIAKDLARVPNP